MGFFDLFKKKESKLSYDPSNIKIADLDLNWVLEYDLKTWIVKEVARYDWRGSGESWEYKLDCGDDELYLNVFEDDKLYLSVSKTVKLRAIDEDLPEHIEKNMRPPKKIIYNGVTYYLEEEAIGHYYDLTEDDNPPGDEVTEWTYYDESEKNLLAIAEWGNFNFSAAVGISAAEHEFSNILPAAAES